MLSRNLTYSSKRHFTKRSRNFISRSVSWYYSLLLWLLWRFNNQHLRHHQIEVIFIHPNSVSRSLYPSFSLSPPSWRDCHIFLIPSPNLSNQSSGHTCFHILCVSFPPLPIQSILSFTRPYIHTFIPSVHCLTRRKIRLIESNAKCRYLKSWPVKGLCGRSFWGPSSEVFVWGGVAAL